MFLFPVQVDVCIKVVKTTRKNISKYDTKSKWLMQNNNEIIDSNSRLVLTLWSHFFLVVTKKWSPTSPESISTEREVKENGELTLMIIVLLERC